MIFDSFIGNRKTIERLRSKLRENRFPHAVIFSGPQGVGKYTSALMIAKALNCIESTAGDTFCDACTSCRKINSGIHPDVITVSVEEEATQIKIAQIRRVLKTLEFQPLEGRNKAFIIDPANLMNSEAANALLKGLEEPPENSFFFLITVNAQDLLLTVRSRCQIYNFKPLTLDEIRHYGIDDELAVRWSQGSIGLARTLDATKLESEREPVIDFLETAVTAHEDQFKDLIAVSADLARSKQGFEKRMAVLCVLVADVLYLKVGLPDRIINIDIQNRLAKIAALVSVDRLIRISEFLRRIESSLRSNANRQMLIDALALVANETVSKWQ